jgi:4-hydroxyphenylpyruvate dioxygenase
MATNEHVTVLGTEYLEYAVRDLDKASIPYDKMGFTCVGYRTDHNRRSKLYMQGDIRIVLTASSLDSDPAYLFSRTHGDGVLTVGYRVQDAKQSIDIATRKGAKLAYGAQVAKGMNGASKQTSAIHVYGDVLNEFISYEGRSRFEDFFPEESRPLDSVKGRFLQTIDHITVNVEKGKMDYWANFYQDMFKFEQIRYFDIRTEKTGLLSRALRNDNGRVTMPFNEPTNSVSQIQEFIDTFHGPGVQHAAFHTSNIILCLSELIQKGFKFLTVPDTYYEAIPKRVPNVTEDLRELAKLGILVDGSPNGYLLQIFTEPLVGPFFFEFIQRKGDNGFGDGNFRALFEAIERDQIRRGILS